MTSSDSGAQPAQGDVPAPPMVLPRPGFFGDMPIQTGRHRVLGLKVKGGDRSFYFLAGVGPWSKRYADRFPVTEDGWALVWEAFTAADPSGAQTYWDGLATSDQTPSAGHAGRPLATHEGSGAAAQGRVNQAAATSEIHGWLWTGIAAQVVGGLIAALAWPRARVETSDLEGPHLVHTGSMAGALVGLGIAQIGALFLLAAVIAFGVKVGIKAARD